MAKRGNQLHSAKLQEELDASTEAEDVISKLPDDILVDIISRLILEEAARTSILSSRWKYLWTFSSVLNFHAPRKLWKLPETIEGTRKHDIEQDKRNDRYVRWVSEVLKLHRGSSINEFRISFQLGGSHETVITDWINTVIAKRVQKLELNLGSLGRGYRKKKYSFPQEWNNILETPHGFSGIESLKSLSLVDVCVTRETLEFFIYNCPLLGQLRVENSESLSGLKVFGSKIQLKYLNIYRCDSINEIEISAPSLLSFKYYGRQIKLQVENVPLLHDVSIGGEYGVQLKNLIEPVRSYLTRLETLELSLDFHEGELQFPVCELLKLRHLTLDISGPGSKSKNLRELTGIIHACPFLQKLTLKFVYINSTGGRRVHKFPKCSHQHLKVVEVIGFVGLPFDLEILCYLLETAVRLEKMTVNPTSTFSLGKYWEFDDHEGKERARERVKQLEAKVPQGVEFVIC